MTFYTISQEGSFHLTSIIKGGGSLIGMVLYGLFYITILVFCIYYLPIIAKDLKSIRDSNQKNQELLVQLLKEIEKQNKD